MSDTATFVISSTEDRKRLLRMVKETASSLERIETEKHLVKEATKKIVEEFQLPGKLVSKLIKTYFKENFKEVVATEEQFQSLYVQVVEGVNAQEE